MNVVRYADRPDPRGEELTKPTFPAHENDVPGARR